MKNPSIQKRKSERGAAILESLLACLLLLLIFFGLFQLFHLSLADMVSRYAVFRGARSAAVGFSDELVARETRIKTIPVSGDRVLPDPGRSDSDPDAFFRLSSDPAVEFGRTKVHIERYMDGTRALSYAYWFGTPVRHDSYKCPLYGQVLESGRCEICGLRAGPSLQVNQNHSNDTVSVSLRYSDYPMTMPMYEAFSRKGTIDIDASTELTNHASAFLQE